MTLKRPFLVLLAIAGLAWPALPSFGHAAELLLLEQRGCAWCLRWDEEIGAYYDRTDEARIAPLRRVDIDAPWPEDLKHITIERFTPTFVLVEGGREIARMRGYGGDEFFWFLLQEMLQKLPATPPQAG